jgi:alpha-glucosidase
VGHWLGDNISNWDHYRYVIAEILEFAALFQIPMVGADVCGFGGNTTTTLCARWAMLGAFSPFYRNHDGDTSIPQEYYRWPEVAEAAKIAIDVRYRLLDYIYTALHRQTVFGDPLLNPLFFMYPDDANTFPIQYQYFYGDSILISPVTEENSTSVSIYLPNDLFYDFWTGAKVQGNGSWVTLSDVAFTSIPLHIKGGSIIPLRESSANTTTELRKKDFVLWIAPNATDQAVGELYLDEGDAIEQPDVSQITFTYDNGFFRMSGTYGYNTSSVISGVVVLGAEKPANNSVVKLAYDESKGTLSLEAWIPLSGDHTLDLKA